MAAFAFTVVTTDNKGINESIGVIHADSQELARQKLIANGFLIRDLRPAKPEELQLHSLRQLRKKLDGSEKEKKLEGTGSVAPPPVKRSYEWVIWAVVGAIIILAFLGGW